VEAGDGFEPLGAVAATGDPAETGAPIATGVVVGGSAIGVTQSIVRSGGPN
jgi:hypothetical protein